MLEKVRKAARDSGEIESAIIENCQTYGDLAQLFRELLEWNSGSGSLDDEAVKFLADAIGDYKPIQ
jgi:hypothetical protein